MDLKVVVSPLVINTCQAPFTLIPQSEHFASLKSGVEEPKQSICVVDTQREVAPKRENRKKKKKGFTGATVCFHLKQSFILARAQS